MQIVLASGSPRRKELLGMLGFGDLIICPAQGDEAPASGMGPGEYVMSLARAKAEEVSKKFDAGSVIIAADTIVYLDGRILGKPADEAEAEEMLRSLSGRSHSVFTGVCVMNGDRVLLQTDESRVYFRPLEEDEIRRYVATGEPMDKAGAYGAQGKAAVFVEKIEGDFFNVMGLPVCLLGKMLKEFGINII